MDTTRSNDRMIFHKFVWLVWMPISFLTALFVAYYGITSYYSKYYSYMESTQVALIGFLYIIIETAFVVAPALVFAGFFKKRKYAWYILVVESISNIVASPILLVVNAASFDAASATGRILGIILDIVIIAYYWKKRRVFNVGKKPLQVTATEPITTEPCIMFCYKCGSNIETDDLFCNRCGTKVK